MKNLLIYYLKKKWHIIAIMSFILIIFTFIIYGDAIFRRETLDGFVPYNPPIHMISAFGASLATIIPLFEFSFKMRKISIDQMYSLPIKRDKLYLCKYITGLIEVIVPVTMAFLTSVLIVLTSTHMFEIYYFFIYYLVLLVVIIAIYTTISFAYTRGNTVIDGLAIVIGYIFLLVPVGYYIWQFNTKMDFDGSYMFLYSPMVLISNAFEALLCNYTPTSSIINIACIISFIVFGLISIAAFVLFIILNKKDKAEASMDKSDSMFGYKMLIPTIVAFTIASTELEIIPIIITIIAGYFTCALYKRSFKIKSKFYIVFAASIIVGMVLALFYN